MTSHPEKTSRWRRVVVTGFASIGLAASMAMGLGVAVANADILDDLESEYGRSNGGGQVAKLLNEALVMRAQGVRPRPADLQAINGALEYRPNQAPLIGALQQVVGNQKKTLAHAGQQSQGGNQIGGPAGISINQGPWQPSPGGNPMIQNENPVFPMPGRW